VRAAACRSRCRHRFVRGERGVEQRAIERQLRLRHQIELHVRRIGAGRRQIVSAGNEQRVDAPGEPAHVALHRQIHGNAAGAFDGSCVRVVHVVVRAPGSEAAAIVDTERDTHERLHARIIAGDPGMLSEGSGGRRSRRRA
jgi:hypothetical protein